MNKPDNNNTFSMKRQQQISIRNHLRAPERKKKTLKKEVKFIFIIEIFSYLIDARNGI
jgi:hypothetical protein